MIDINELRRLAQAATSGEWYVERGNHIRGRIKATDGEEEWHPVIACTDDDETNVDFEANAAFIAAANPTAISELLDRLEVGEKERDAAELMSLALRAKIEAAENDAAHQKALAASALRVAEGWERKCGELRVELETERMRLAACGVVALANTPDSAKQAREMRPEYWSASCGDVARMVDENIKLLARIREMERQEPVAWAATDETCRIVEALSFNQSRRFDTPLYALPGAKGE